MINIEGNREYFDECFNKRTISEHFIADTVFEKCEFINCNFSSVIFSECKFIDCVFEQCNLSLINIPNSRFSNVEFIESKLVGIDWTKAYWPKFDFYSSLKFKNSILDSCNFFALKLHESYFEECRLHNVDFRNTELHKSSIICCDLSNSSFMHTDLEYVDFTESHSFDIDIRNNKIAKAKFSKFEALGLLSYLDIELID